MIAEIRKLQQVIEDEMSKHGKHHDLSDDCLRGKDRLGAQIHQNEMTVCGKRVMDAHRRIGELLDKMLASVAD